LSRSFRGKNGWQDQLKAGQSRVEGRGKRQCLSKGGRGKGGDSQIYSNKSVNTRGGKTSNKKGLWSGKKKKLGDRLVGTWGKDVKEVRSKMQRERGVDAAGNKGRKLLRVKKKRQNRWP